MIGARGAATQANAARRAGNALLNSLASYLTGRPMPLRRGSDLDNVLSRRDAPCYAAGLDVLRPRDDGTPSGVTLPNPLIEGPLTWPGQHAGLLGGETDRVTPVPQGANTVVIAN